MNTILVDDELWMLRQFEDECMSIPDIKLIGKFMSGKKALEFAQTSVVDLAFLDVGMPVMNGLELAKALRELYPKMIIIFVSAHGECMPEAFKTRDADYFILKPYKKEDVAAAIERAQLLSGRLKKAVTMQTFGRFNCYVSGVPVNFSSMKAKEILAFLVDRRGSSVDVEEIYDVLWNGRPYSKPEVNVYYNAIKRLRDTLETAGIPQLLVSLPREFKLNTEMFDCDLYGFMNGDKAAISAFNGEYMTNYSWGEETLATLTEMKLKYDAE